MTALLPASPALAFALGAFAMLSFIAAVVLVLIVMSIRDDVNSDPFWEGAAPGGPSVFDQDGFRIIPQSTATMIESKEGDTPQSSDAQVAELSRKVERLRKSIARMSCEIEQTEEDKAALVSDLQSALAALTKAQGGAKP